MSVKVSSVAYHRNGIGGDPFYVCLFTDSEQRNAQFVGIVPSVYVSDEDHEAPDFSAESGCQPCYVLDVNLLAAGDIAFGSNSWRGDNYFETLRLAAQSYSTASVA